MICNDMNFNGSDLDLDLDADLAFYVYEYITDTCTSIMTFHCFSDLFDSRSLLVNFDMVFYNLDVLELTIILTYLALITVYLTVPTGELSSYVLQHYHDVTAHLHLQLVRAAHIPTRSHR